MNGKQPMTTEEEESHDESSEDLTPHCPAGVPDDRKWEAETVRETTLQFFDTCSWCYDEDEMPEIGATVIRCRGQYSSNNIHRPGHEYDEVKGDKGDSDSD